MPRQPTVDAASIRAFASRDRSAVRRAREGYWSERKARLGFAEVLRIADQLRDQARALDPAWPTERDREADLETHQRVAAQLARVPRPARRR